MSGGMYNQVFGMNPLADILLAVHNLDRDEVGRFRDCFIAEGEFIVYTRNGGPNRECAHKKEADIGEHSECKHRTETRVVPEMETAAVGAHLVFARATGKEVEKTVRICESPDSEACFCYGCIMKYHIKKHPLYLRDKDDTFDSTYATIYFKIPEAHLDVLKKLDIGKWDPETRWKEAIEKLKESNKGG